MTIKRQKKTNYTLNEIKTKLIYYYYVVKKCDYDEVIDYINGLSEEQIISEFKEKRLK